ncbi:MAG: hypothetical protein NTU58_00015 [Candidatus Nealsonbacteria bacterium]|nr:hypothetical protein [Candidatus Nealsonbacteria bacterium]
MGKLIKALNSAIALEVEKKEGTILFTAHFSRNDSEQRTVPIILIWKKWLSKDFKSTLQNEMIFLCKHPEVAQELYSLCNFINKKKAEIIYHDYANTDELEYKEDGKSIAIQWRTEEPESGVFLYFEPIGEHLPDGLIIVSPSDFFNTIKELLE